LSSTRLALSASSRLAALLVLVHACAGAALALCVPGPAGYAAGAALAALGAAAAWSRALLRAPTSVRALELAGEALILELANGARLEVPVGPRRFVSRFAVALVLGAPARRTVLVAADMLDPGAFRVLRVWALWGRLPGAARQLSA